MRLRYTGKLEDRGTAVRSDDDVLRDRDWVYLPDPGLVEAVNIALLLEQPLLVTGEPGTGKTQLAYSIAAELKLGDVLRFDTKSNSTYRDLFYRFDALRSFRDAQNQVKGRTSLDYIVYAALGQAILLAHPQPQAGDYVRGFVHPGEATRSLVLIDEVDKAPRDFPNDLLNEIEQMGFEIPEMEVRIPPARRLRPVVVITSNSERLLPSAFLRRCVYCHIPFPQDENRMKKIVSERLGQDFPFDGRLLEDAVRIFYLLRKDSLSLRKKPSTAEMLGWVVALRDHFGGPDAPLRNDRAFVSASLSCLLKDPQDMQNGATAVDAALQAQQ